MMNKNDNFTRKLETVKKLHVYFRTLNTEKIFEIWNSNG